VFGLSAGLEGLDDDHAAAAAGARGGERGSGCGVGGSLAFGICACACGRLQQLAGLRQALVALAASEEALVAEAVEALGQDVEQEAADELGHIEDHGGVRPGPSIR
jgi:hypothetical protein